MKYLVAWHTITPQHKRQQTKKHKNGTCKKLPTIQVKLRTHHNNSYNKSQREALFVKFILIKNSTCFGQIYRPSSGISTLYTQQ